MNILILNWRDIKNPTSGGAETLTHEIARRWVKWGNNVTQISAGFPGGEKKETIDGVNITRLGKWWSVHFLAFWHYVFNLRKSVDIVIDEVHWFPFFSLLYAKNKTILLVCEVANNLFYQVFPLPIAIFWRIVEKFYLWLYKNTPTMAISPSTNKDLIKEGFNKKKITVLPMGITFPANIEKYQKLSKEKNPTLIYLGRLNKQKGAQDALLAFKIVKKQIPEAILWIVGTGKEEYVRNYKLQITNYKLQDFVKLFGYVSEEKKFELLARAHILIVPSVHEGWGLVVAEAGIVNTPAIVYNAAGLKDIIKNSVNGIVTDPKPNQLAKHIIGLFEDSFLLNKLSKNALIKAQQYNWDNTAATALKAIKKAHNIL